MKITCYGPRGSIPAPSRNNFNTTEYGGNTSCYLVEAGPFNIILDMGSGVLTAGDDLLRSGRGVGKHFIVPISHWHWDHIQGGLSVSHCSFLATHSTSTDLPQPEGSQRFRLTGPSKQS